MECYHCASAHVEYSRFHLYARPEELNREADAKLHERMLTSGVEIPDVDHWGDLAMPGQEAVDSLRSALADGTVSGSEDGRPPRSADGRVSELRWRRHVLRRRVEQSLPRLRPTTA